MCVRLLSALILAAAVTAGPATAQQPRATGGDAAQDAARQSFEALPDVDRTAIQDGLVWTGDYNGTVDGRFGRATHDAIVAFARRTRLPTDGTLDATGRGALAAAARQAKGSVRFTAIDDTRGGLHISLPLNLLPKQTPLAKGTRYGSGDGKFDVETMTAPEAPDGLAKAFDAARAEGPDRKVTYKVLRPDFFVVAGESKGRAFYVRMARGDHGGPVLSGFRLSYPLAARARFQRLTVAIANSLSVAGAAVAPGVAPSAVAAVPPSPRTAAGAVVGRGLIVTSLPEGACRTPAVGGYPARILRENHAGALTLLQVADIGAAPAAVRAAAPAPGTAVVVLAYATGPQPPAADPLLVSPGDVRAAAGDGPPRIFAPTLERAAASLVFDRTGALIGLLPASNDVAGQAASPLRALAGGAALTALLGVDLPPAAAAAAVKTAGEIVAAVGPSIVPVACK